MLDAPSDNLALETEEKKPNNAKVISKFLDWDTSKTIISTALPFSAARLSIVIGDFGNAIFISELGRTALAGYSLINAIQAVIISAPASILYATGILVSRAKIQNDYQTAGRILRNSWLLSVLLSIPTIFFAIFSDKLLILSGQPKEASSVAGSYFQTYAAAVPCELMLISTQQFILALDQPWLVFATSTINALLTLGFAYPFIFGKSIFPKKEVAGLGYASTLAAYLTFGGLLLYLKINSQYAKYEIFSFKPSVKKSIDCLKDLIKLGGYIGVQSASEVVNIFITTIFIGWMGEEALATQQLPSQYQYILSVPLVMGSQVIGVLVSQHIYKNNIKRLAFTNLKLSMIYTSISGIILCIAPKTLMKPFIDIYDPKNAEIVSSGQILFRIYAATLLLNSVYHNSVGVLRGMNNTKTAMIVGFLNNCGVNLILAYTLGFSADLNLTGIFLAALTGTFLSTTLLSGKMYKEISEKPELHSKEIDILENTAQDTDHQETTFIKAPITFLMQKLSYVFCGCRKRNKSPDEEPLISPNARGTL